jgi:hypothetical protein
MKKASTIIISTLVVLSALVTLSPVPAKAAEVSAISHCALTVGRPYKQATSTTVYVVTGGCFKRPVFNPDVFFSHYTGWDEVITVDTALLAAVVDHPLRFMPWGKRKPYRTGSLIKTVDDPKVYLVVDGKAYPIKDEAIFHELGFEFGHIEDVTSDVFSLIEKRTEEVGGVAGVPVSLVFKYPVDSKVYILKDEHGLMVKSYIPDMTSLTAIAKPDSVAVLPRSMQFPDAASGDTSYLKYGYATPDLAAPSVIFTTPLEFSTLGGVFKIGIEATDDKKVAWVKFKIDDRILVIDEVAPFDAYVDTTVYADGEHRMQVLAGDGEGKVSQTVSRTVYFENGDEPDASDQTPPSLAITSPADNEAISSMTAINVMATDSSGVAWVKFMIGDRVLLVDDRAPYYVDVDTTMFASGPLTVTVVAEDKMKNQTTVSRTFMVAHAQ